MKKSQPMRTEIAYVTRVYCHALSLGPSPATPPETRPQREQAVAAVSPAPIAITQGVSLTFSTTATSPENESSTGEPAVMNFMRSQLSSGKSQPRPVPLPMIDQPGQANDADDAEDADKSMGSREAGNATLRKVVGRRFAWARELCGLGQAEAALLLGWANSTQLSLIEKGARLPPHLVLLRTAEIYGASTDYLLGVAEEPERDQFAASRSGALRRMQGLLETNARAVTDALLSAIKSDSTAELRSIRFVTEIQALLDGIDAFQSANADFFDELRGGATLLRRAGEARDALAKVVTLMNAIDRRSAYAVERAREATARELPEPSASVGTR